MYNRNCGNCLFCNVGYLTEDEPSWYNTHMSKRQWDRFDEEACREGVAFTKQVTTQVPKRCFGKGITKQRNMHSAILNKIETRILKRYMV